MTQSNICEHPRQLTREFKPTCLLETFMITGAKFVVSGLILKSLSEKICPKLTLSLLIIDSSASFEREALTIRRLANIFE